MNIHRISVVRSLLLVLALTLLVGCGGGSSPNSTAPLSAANLNLVFVVSPDLDHPADNDINIDTANLSNQGLQRSLLMATYLKRRVLGTKNVTDIYALQPMTHLQTVNQYPDMAAIGYIQQFALLNQITLTSTGSPLYTANSYPLNASYASAFVLNGVSISCPGCQGLVFDDTGGNNVALVTAIVNANVPGFHVFSAPWKTISDLMANITKLKGYNLNLPATYMGPNYVYAISIAPSGDASLVTYNSNLNPPSSYPVLPSPVAGASCGAQAPINIAEPGENNNARIPLGINKNETIYMIRHAEAHPTKEWDDGNFVAAGQWRALALANAVRGKISPTLLYSIDPAQVLPGAYTPPGAGNSNFSYVRPSLTVEPYAIANNLPYYLVSDFELFDNNSPLATSNFFFFNPKFSNQTVLLAWEHKHFPPIITELLKN